MDLKQDKIIEEILISEVTQPFEKLKVGQEEIRQKFADIEDAQGYIFFKNAGVGRYIFYMNFICDIHSQSNGRK